MLDCIYTALYDKYDAQVILCAQETHKGNASVICSRICNKNKFACCQLRSSFLVLLRVSGPYLIYFWQYYQAEYESVNNSDKTEYSVQPYYLHAKINSA